MALDFAGYGVGGLLAGLALLRGGKAVHPHGVVYGDSGGPQFLGAGDEETDIVISVTSTGDGPCYATNVTTRTDTEAALEFLSQFVDLS